MPAPLDLITSPDPDVRVEARMVIIEWSGHRFLCSADAAHRLSDVLFSASLAAEAAAAGGSEAS